MSRSLVVRVVVSLLAGLAALLVVEIAIAAATPLADNATSDLTIALYLILDPRSPYVQLVALAAGALATMVGLVMFVAVDSAVWLAAVGRAVLLGVLVGIASLAGAAGGWAITTSDRQGDIAATRWWLMDTAPPQVSVTVPDKLVHEVAQIDVSVSDEGPYHIAGIDVDGTPITPTLHLALDTTSLPDGQHTVNVTVEDESRQHNRAQAQAFFRTDTQWWLNDVTPPTITLTIPVTLTRAAVTVTLDTADEGDYRITRFTLDNASLPITPEQVVDASRLPDGKHTVVVEAEDESRQRNHSQATGVFWSDTTPPSVAIKLDPPVGTQGHTQIIDLAVNEPVSGITATLRLNRARLLCWCGLQICSATAARSRPPLL
jgi:hypothetical protein